MIGTGKESLLLIERLENFNMCHTLVIPKRHCSDSLVKSPARKKKKISGYSDVPDNKKK